jgi:hypothetical protein
MTDVSRTLKMLASKKASAHILQITWSMMVLAPNFSATSVKNQAIQLIDALKTATTKVQWLLNQKVVWVLSQASFAIFATSLATQLKDVSRTQTTLTHLEAVVNQNITVTSVIKMVTLLIDASIIQITQDPNQWAQIHPEWVNPSISVTSAKSQVTALKDVSRIL